MQWNTRSGLDPTSLCTVEMPSAFEQARFIKVAQTHFGAAYIQWRCVRDLLHSPQGLNSRCIDPICTHLRHIHFSTIACLSLTWNSCCQHDRPGRPSMQQLKHQRQTRS